MVIGPTGNVGIGTVSPDALLEVTGAILADGTATSTGYQLTNAADNANTVRLYNNGVDDTVLLPGKSGGNVLVNSFGNAATLLTITDGGVASFTGCVGIGTTVPTANNNLHIYSTTDYEPAFLLESATNGAIGPALVMKHTSASALSLIHI